MLMMTQLIGFGAGGLRQPPALSFLQLTEDPTDLTNYSFAGVNFGATDDTRRIICVVHFGQQINSRSINSATIGGVAATIHVNLAGTLQGLGIISALVPTGTSGTVAVNLSGSADRCAIASYRAINETTGTPLTASDTSVTSGLLSTTIDIPANGWVIAGASRTQAGATFTAAGFTDAYNSYWAEAAGVARHGGFTSGMTAQTGRTISSQSSNTGAQNGNLAAISWG